MLIERRMANIKVQHRLYTRRELPGVAGRATVTRAYQRRKAGQAYRSEEDTPVRYNCAPGSSNSLDGWLAVGAEYAARD